MATPRRTSGGSGTTARRIATGATPMAIAVALLGTSAATAEATTIYNRHWGGGKCLDADRTQNRTGGAVQLWDCNGWDNQQWDMWSDGTIHSRWNGRCLDADPGTDRNGGTVYLWECLSPPTRQQTWYRRDNGEIASALNGRCLDAAADGGGNPTKVQMWDCWGWVNAKWTLAPEVSCSGELARPRCGPRRSPLPSASPPSSPSPPPPPPPPPSSSPPPPSPAAPPPRDACEPSRSASDFGLRARVRRSRAGRPHKAVTVRYGRRVRVEGRLTRKDGGPVTGGQICVVARKAVAGGARRERGALVTDQDGRFSFQVRSGPSQRLWFVYRAGGAAASVRVRVRAPLSLHATPRTLRNGQTVTLRGRLRARPRKRGALVLLQARRPGRWQTFGTARTGTRGRFSFDYRFTNTRGAQVYELRARMPAHPGSAFATGTSRVARVRVRGG